MADKIIVNGIVRDMTPGEIADMQKQSAILEAQEAARPMTESEVVRMLITAQVNALDVDDNTALRMVSFYPEWASGSTYAAGFKAQYGGGLWRCLQAHTSQTGWEPENAPALWEQINETHTGELTDPIPYSGNMALTAGLYYIQDSAVYLCTRDTENLVYHALADLVGIYVEPV